MVPICLAGLVLNRAWGGVAGVGGIDNVGQKGTGGGTDHEDHRKGADRPQLRDADPPPRETIAAPSLYLV